MQNNILIYDVMKNNFNNILQNMPDLFLHPRYSLGIYKEDILSKLNYYNYKHRILFIAGLPKSGTTWVENFFFNVPGYCPRKISGDPNIIIKQDLPYNAFEKIPKYGYSYIKTHVNPTEENFKILENANIKKIIVMIRDNRDVSISRYYHRLKRPKKPNEPNYLDYRKMDIDEALFNSIELDINKSMPWIKGWIKGPTD